MSKGMKDLLAIASLTMAMAVAGENPEKMPIKPAHALTNKEKKKCKSCHFFSKNGGVCSCKLMVRSMSYITPMKPACSNYKKRKNREH